MQKRKILFLGETYRADAITWMNGLKEFGNFEIVTWELNQTNLGLNRIKRIIEWILAVIRIKKIVKSYKPDMIIAERTTSYGFLATFSGMKPTAVAQQGMTDIWPPNSKTRFFKKKLQDYTFKHADLLHAWGKLMAIHMKNSGTDMNKVMVLPKGINLEQFVFESNYSTTKINAVVTRTLEPEYCHDVILKAFQLINEFGIDFTLTIIGDGSLMNYLKKLSEEYNIADKIIFTGRLDGQKVSQILQKSNFYISMPVTEGVSASLFEAMASGCFPVVTDLPGNRNYINNYENGILIPKGNYILLAEEIASAWNRPIWRNEVLKNNRVFVEENADYSVNMKIIADKYHEMIDKSVTSN